MERFGIRVCVRLTPFCMGEAERKNVLISILIFDWHSTDADVQIAQFSPTFGSSYLDLKFK